MKKIKTHQPGVTISYKVVDRSEYGPLRGEPIYLVLVHKHGVPVYEDNCYKCDLSSMLNELDDPTNPW